MAKKLSKSEVKQARSSRAQDVGEAQAKANAPSRKAQEVLNTHRAKKTADARQRIIDTHADSDEEAPGFETDDKGKVKGGNKKSLTLHDGKPGSGAGLKPGDWHAPASNPGAAARVPDQPLQPESLQSHGKGILYDKDLANPPYNTGDPVDADAGPTGSLSPEQKTAERKKAEKATPRSKMADPDNPAIGRGGKKDATASPNPIGHRHRGTSDVPGGSNSGVDEL